MTPAGRWATTALVDGPWLGLDTATDSPGLAVVTADGVLVEYVWRSRRGHTRQMAPRVMAALGDLGLAVADLAGIAVALGPGSYTGLRVGLALGKGLAFAAGVPLVGVPSLDVVAAPLSPPEVERSAPLWAVLHAGRGRVVACAYPAQGPWPEATRLMPVPIERVLEGATPGDWIAGELDAAQRAAALAAGLHAASPAASLRRPSWVAQLGAQRRANAARTVEELAGLEPLYPASTQDGREGSGPQ